MSEYTPIMPPNAKIGDAPIMATDTGFTHDGKRIFIEGDDLDARRFQRAMAKYYGLVATKAELEETCKRK